METRSNNILVGGVTLALIALERKNDGDAVAVLQEHATRTAGGVSPAPVIRPFQTPCLRPLGVSCNSDIGCSF